MSLPSDEQAALLWPIKAQGAVTRLNPLGDPAIQQFYQKSMEQGRMLECSIADANNWLMEKKQDLIEKILVYTHMNSLAVDGQLGHIPRVPKYIADSLSILNTVNKLQTEITGLIAAIEQNITSLLSIEASMLQMIQANLNSLANLLNNICNWGLPPLPSIPNLWPELVWNWNGFTFSPLALFAALKSNTSFNFNFTFANCSLGPTIGSGGLTANNPASVQSLSGLNFGTVLYNPPLNGYQWNQPPIDGTDITDPAFITQMQGITSPPVYGPTFNPNQSMYGAVPDPHTIISAYLMPAATFCADIVSICPLLRPNTVFVTDADYANPNYAVRTPQLQKDLVHFINLSEIIASNFDPFVVSAWLLYLNSARAGRAGIWLPNFEAIYNTYIMPSVASLQNTSVPWNDVLGQTNYEWMGTWTNITSYLANDIVTFSGAQYLALIDTTGVQPGTSVTTWGPVPAGTVYSDAPVVPFTTTFQSLTPGSQAHLLWQLSYIEASLLGYTRNKTWDTNQDTSYLSGPTGADLDYRPTAITAPSSSLILGQGTAEFPVPITFPTAMAATLNAVVALATTNIQNDTTYLSPRLGNRFTYNQFAQATMVDRFSQFWRDFATNLTNFLAQDPYLVSFAITYPEILDGVLDPLSAFTAAYASLQTDTGSRNRNWISGTPLLPIPIQPLVSFSNSSTPTGATNGWTLPPTDFDPVAFLARPDIQGLPIPIQTAMLRTNLSYAGLSTFQSDFQQSVADLLAVAQAAIASLAVGTISATSITSNILTVVTSNSFSVGDNVQLTGTEESFLNGQTVTLISASSTQFTAAFTNPDYSNPTDTGVAWGSSPSGADTNSFITDVAVPTALLEDQVAVQVQSNGHVNIVQPGAISIVPGSSNPSVYFAPIPDGVTIAAAPSIGDSVDLAMSYGDEYPLSTAVSWTVGGLLYAKTDGTLTQNFSTILSELAALAPTPATITQTSISGQTVVTGITTTTAPFVDTITAPTAAFLTPPTATPGTANAVTGVTDTTDPAVITVTPTTTVLSKNILTVTCANSFAAGDYVLLSGTGESYLNGQIVVVLTASGTQFTCNFCAAPFTNASDSGTAAAATGWLVPVGRVIDYDAINQIVTFIYEPHAPALFPRPKANV